MTWRVEHGDCLATSFDWEAWQFDAIITDPPYSSGTRREAAKGVRKSMNRATEDAAWFGSDSLTVNGFGFLLRSCALEWHRLLKPGGHLLCFIDWRMMPTAAAAIESADLRHNGVLVWDKGSFGMGSYFRNQHEFVLHFSKSKGWGPGRRDESNVLRCPRPRNADHPTEKPVELLRRLLTVVTPPYGKVLDPFAGSGSTGVACVLEGRHFIGIEREAEYVEIARRRIDAASAQERLPV